MAKTAKKDDREEIKKIEEMDVKETQEKLKALKLKLASIQKQKHDAKKKACWLMKQDVFDDVVEMLGLQVEAEKCVDLKSCDLFRLKIKNKMQALLSAQN